MTNGSLNLKLILKLPTLLISITATYGVSTAGADCKNIDLPGALRYTSYLSFGWLHELGRNTGMVSLPIGSFPPGLAVIPVVRESIAVHLETCGP